jgi:hypothetical protein
VRIDLGFIGQPGGDQPGADLPHRRDLQAVADRPGDRETARRRDVGQAGLLSVGLTVLQPSLNCWAAVPLQV